MLGRLPAVRQHYHRNPRGKQWRRLAKPARIPELLLQTHDWGAPQVACDDLSLAESLLVDSGYKKVAEDSAGEAPSAAGPANAAGQLESVRVAGTNLETGAANPFSLYNPSGRNLHAPELAAPIVLHNATQQAAALHVRRLPREASSPSSGRQSPPFNPFPSPYRDRS